MTEITVTFSEREARALIPSPTELSLAETNDKLNAAEDAVAKIRAAVREQAPEPAAEQESLA